MNYLIQLRRDPQFSRHAHYEARLSLHVPLAVAAARVLHERWTPAKRPKANLDRAYL